jgi:hypothetical protein
MDQDQCMCQNKTSMTYFVERWDRRTWWLHQVFHLVGNLPFLVLVLVLGSLLLLAEQSMNNEWDDRLQTTIVSLLRLTTGSLLVGDRWSAVGFRSFVWFDEEEGDQSERGKCLPPTARTSNHKLKWPLFCRGKLSAEQIDDVSTYEGQTVLPRPT